MREVSPKATPPSSETPTGPVNPENVMLAVHAELKDRVKRAEAWMIWLTAAMALFALCSVVVGYFQWAAMNAQLGEMKQGGVDTKALADAAVRQEKDTDSLVKQTAEQVKRTETLAERMKEQADQTRVIANEAVTELELSQRPYLMVKATLTKGVKWDERGGRFTVRLTATNLGRTPADAVAATSEVYLTGYGTGDPFAEKAGFCGRWKTYSGERVPPGMQFLGNESELLLPDPVFRRADRHLQFVYVITCVHYRSIFNGKQYTEDNLFQLFDVSHGDERGLVLGEDLESEHLSLKAFEIPTNSSWKSSSEK